MEFIHERCKILGFWNRSIQRVIQTYIAIGVDNI